MSVTRVEYGKVLSPRRWVGVDLLKANLFPYLVMVLMVFTLVSLFHVWSRVRVVDLNLEISETKRLLKDARQEKARLSLEVASLRTPARIEEVAKNELGMAVPSEQQVVTVK